MGSWKMNTGINHAPAYEVSGRPFASGSINASSATKVEFPYVTRWIYVINFGSERVRVGFSEAGVDGTNYFHIGKTSAADIGASSQRLEMKVSELWLSGSPDVSIVAGLTTIRPEATSMGAGLPNWSGSAGVG
jgi:hypothetical protein